MEISDVEKMQANKDVEGLIKLLTDKRRRTAYFRLRRRAAYALGNMKDKRAAEPLLQVRKTLSGSLYGTSTVIKARLMTDEDIEKEKLFRTTRAALRKIVTEMAVQKDVESLAKLLMNKRWSDPFEEIANATDVANALGNTKDAQAVESILQAWRL